MGATIAERGDDPADAAVYRLVQADLLHAASAPAHEGQAAIVAMLGLWLALNHPAGGYPEGIAETLRRHGRAQLSVETDPRGRAWGFVVADRQVELAPMIARALERWNEASLRALEAPAVH